MTKEKNMTKADKKKKGSHQEAGSLNRSTGHTKLQIKRKRPLTKSTIFMGQRIKEKRKIGIKKNGPKINHFTIHNQTMKKLKINDSHILKMMKLTKNGREHRNRQIDPEDNRNTIKSTTATGITKIGIRENSPSQNKKVSNNSMIRVHKQRGFG